MKHSEVLKTYLLLLIRTRTGGPNNIKKKKNINSLNLLRYTYNSFGFIVQSQLMIS